MFESLLSETSFWSAEALSSEVIISSRVRFSRNISNLPFPQKSSDKELDRALKQVEKYSKSNGSEFYRMKKIPPADRRFLRERNLISEEMEKMDRSGLLIGTPGYSVHVNDRSHVKIQVLRPGLSMHEVYSTAVRVDEEINDKIAYSFSDKFGYLSADPSMSGTGMKASVLAHLPFTAATGSLSEVNKVFDSMDVVFEPAVNVKNRCAFYIASNKTSLGISEFEIIESAEEFSEILINFETTAREDFYAENRLYVEDLVWRAFGTLKYSRTISYTDALELISRLRYGIVLYIIKDFSLTKINDLMIKIQPGHLEKIYGTDAGSDIDVIRADFLREAFKG